MKQSSRKKEKKRNRKRRKYNKILGVFDQFMKNKKSKLKAQKYIKEFALKNKIK